MPPGSPPPPLSSPALQALSTGLGRSGPPPHSLLWWSGEGVLRRATGRTSVESARLQWGGRAGLGGELSSSGQQWGAAGRGGVTGKRGAQKEPARGRVLLASGLRGAPGVHGQAPSAFGAASCWRPALGIAWGAQAAPLCVRGRCPGTRQQQAGAAPLPLTPYPHPRPLSSWAPGATLGTLGRRAGSLAPSRAQGSQEMPCGPTDREEIAEAWETPSACLSQRPGGRPLTALAPAPRVAPAPRALPPVPCLASLGAAPPERRRANSKAARGDSPRAAGRVVSTMRWDEGVS